MTATTPDSFREVCLIGVLPSGGSEVQFAGFTEDITGLDFGDKDIEGVPLVNGGRVTKWSPQADESVTLKVYPISALRDGTGVSQWFNPQDTEDTTQPVLVDNTRNRTLHALYMLWATSLPTAASSAVTAGQYAYRVQVINAYMTSYKPSFDDKHFSAEVTFKWPPFNKAGSANKREESQSNAGTAMPVATKTATSFT